MARHVETILAVLEGHHTSEHELLWPRLLERVPEELAPVVHLMESQHEQIHEHLEQTLALLPRWRAGATPADRDRLGTAVEALVEALTEHMAAEERHLLPLAARAVAEAEWAELGERGMRKTPPPASLRRMRAVRVWAHASRSLEAPIRSVAMSLWMREERVDGCANRSGPHHQW